MSVGDDSQSMRDFIDALRVALGLAPLYKQPEPTPPMVETTWKTFATKSKRAGSS